MTRTTWSKRCTAVGFILVTIFGNFVLTGWIFGSVPGSVLQYGFWTGVFLALIGGLGMLCETILSVIYPTDRVSPRDGHSSSDPATAADVAVANKVAAQQARSQQAADLSQPSNPPQYSNPPRYSNPPQSSR